MKNEILQKAEALKKNNPGVVKTLLGSSDKFVIIVGDEGAVISYFKGITLNDRLFANIADANDMKKIESFFQKDQDAYIYLLIDVLEQNYTEHSFPPVNIIMLRNLVRNKLKRDYADDILKHGFLIEKTKSDKPLWRYLFVTCPIISPISEWMDFLIDLNNPLGSINLLPIESINLIKKLNKSSFATKPKEQSEWQIFVLHNKSSGFRQIAFYKDKIIFTRLINDDGETNPDVVAGTIDQELHNSVEYLKRLSVNEDQKFDIYVITSQDIKNSLTTIKLPGKFVSVLTPHEVANKVGFKAITRPEDRFCDTLISGDFIQSSSIYNFNTKESFLISATNKFLLKLPLINIILVIILVSTIIYRQFGLMGTLSAINFNEKNISELNRQLSNLSQGDEEIEVENILDIVTLYKALTGSKYTPFNIISNFQKTKTDNVAVKSFDWNLKEDLVTTRKGAPQELKSSINCKIEVDFSGAQSSYRELWDKYNIYLDQIENSFANFEVTTSRATDKITFEEQKKVIPVSITITGPKNEPTKPRGAR